MLLYTFILLWAVAININAIRSPYHNNKTILGFKLHEILSAYNVGNTSHFILFSLATDADISSWRTNSLDKSGLKHFALLTELSRGEEGERSRWTAPLVEGHFQLVGSSVCDGRVAWEFGQSFPNMLSLPWRSWPLCSPQAHQPLPSQCGSNWSYQMQD